MHGIHCTQCTHCVNKLHVEAVHLGYTCIETVPQIYICVHCTQCVHCADSIHFSCNLHDVCVVYNRAMHTVQTLCAMWSLHTMFNSVVHSVVLSVLNEFRPPKAQPETARRKDAFVQSILKSTHK